MVSFSQLFKLFTRNKATPIQQEFCVLFTFLPATRWEGKQRTFNKWKIISKIKFKIQFIVNFSSQNESFPRVFKFGKMPLSSFQFFVESTQYIHIPQITSTQTFVIYYFTALRIVRSAAVAITFLHPNQDEVTLTTVCYKKRTPTVQVKSSFPTDEGEVLYVRWKLSPMNRWGLQGLVSEWERKRENRGNLSFM